MLIRKQYILYKIIYMQSYAHKYTWVFICLNVSNDVPDCPTSGQTVAPQPRASWRTWSDKALEDTELSGARKMSKLVWNFYSDCWENGPLLFYKFDSRMGESANSFAICPSNVCCVLLLLQVRCNKDQPPWSSRITSAAPNFPRWSGRSGALQQKKSEQTCGLWANCGR